MGAHFEIEYITSVKFKVFDSNPNAYCMFCVDKMEYEDRMKPWVAQLAKGTGKFRWDMTFCKSYYEKSKLGAGFACVVFELYGPAFYRYGKVVDFKTGELQEGFLHVHEEGIDLVDENEIYYSKDKGLFRQRKAVCINETISGAFVPDDVPF